MCRKTSSVLYSDTNRVNPTHTQPPMKEDPPKLPLCWSLEQPVTSCLQQLDWFTHVQPSQLPPQPRKHLLGPRSTSPLSVEHLHCPASFPSLPCLSYPASSLQTLTHLPTQFSTGAVSVLQSCMMCYQWQIREVRRRFEPNDSINTAKQFVCSCLHWSVEIKDVRILKRTIWQSCNIWRQGTQGGWYSKADVEAIKCDQNFRI